MCMLTTTEEAGGFCSLPLRKRVAHAHHNRLGSLAHLLRMAVLSFLSAEPQQALVSKDNQEPAEGSLTPHAVGGCN